MDSGHFKSLVDGDYQALSIGSAVSPFSPLGELYTALFLDRSSVVGGTLPHAETQAGVLVLTPCRSSEWHQRCTRNTPKWHYVTSYLNGGIFFCHCLNDVSLSFSLYAIGVLNTHACTVHAYIYVPKCLCVNIWHNYWDMFILNNHANQARPDT